MTKSLSVLSLLSIAGLIHCASSVEPSSDSAPPVADQGLEPAALPTDRCVAEIERPSPADLVLKLGTEITLKTGGAICPVGQNDKLAYRYYVEEVDRNGNILSPRKSPQGPTEWSLTKSTFDTSVLDGPGRYRIYGFSLPRTMIAAWQANDPVARARSTRTGNAYVDLVTTSWGSAAPLACSVTCGGGTQTVPAACKDNNNVTRPDSWCTGNKPADGSQSCNAQACPLTGNTVTLNGFEDYVVTNTSHAHVENSDPMMCMMFGDCYDIHTYRVEGTWQDPETAANFTLRVIFGTKPTAAGDYASMGTYEPGPGYAFAQLDRNVPGVGWRRYECLIGNAAIKVRTGTDGQLHVLVDDSQFGNNGNTIPVVGDLRVNP